MKSMNKLMTKVQNKSLLLLLVDFDSCTFFDSFHGVWHTMKACNDQKTKFALVEVKNKTSE